MPLRDHFHPPVSKRGSWQGFFGGWPAMMVQRMFPDLPTRYVAEPRVQLGSFADFEDSRKPANEQREDEGSSREQYQYEVLFFDFEHDRRLIAAIEFVCPANKHRPEVRRRFVKKCASMLQEGVCVSIVDLVTTHGFNLYSDLLALIDQSDPSFSRNPSPIYAVTVRPRKVEPQARLDVWAYPLAVGQLLPTLPVWLSEEQRMPLDLEGSYEDTCRVLRIA